MKKIPKLRFPEFSDEWKEQRLSKIGNIVTGSTPETSKTEYYGGEYLFVSPIDIKSNRYIKNTKTTLTELGFNKGRKIPKMSICFVCIGSTIGKVAQVLEECITNQQINSIIPFKDISNNFIYSCLENKSDKIKLLAGEQAVPLINKSDFSKINIFIPSFPEQEKIASFLSEVDKSIEILEEEKGLWEKYKKGIMQKIFSQKLRFKDENGNDYPEWEEKRLWEISTLITKGTTPKKFNENLFDKIKYIKIESLTNNKINNENCLFIDKITHETELKRSILQENDLLFAIAGSLGKNAIVKKENLPANTNQALAIIRLSVNQNYLFILQLLNSNLMKRYILENVSVGAQPNLNLEQVNNFKFYYPSLPEQEKIANFLSTIDEKLEIVEEELKLVKELKKGLLQQMFV